MLGTSVLAFPKALALDIGIPISNDRPIKNASVQPKPCPANDHLCSISATQVIRAAAPRPHLSQNPVPKSTLHLGTPQRFCHAYGMFPTHSAA